MESKITAYGNGMYHSKKHGRLFTAEEIGASIGVFGLKFMIEDFDSKEDHTDRQLALIVSKVLKGLCKLDENKNINPKISSIKKECLDILKKLNR